MINLETYTIINKNEYIENLTQTSSKVPEKRNFRDHIERGFIVLDKPMGPTSHEIVSTVKTILNIKKAGHLGTLDPNVSGVLPIGLEKTTKILSLLTGSDKRYICNLRLQQPVKFEEVRKAVDEFVGEIYQFPPVKSNVAMKLRKRVIYSIEIIENIGNEYLLDVSCQAGTYIRVLCTDIGKVLGVGGEMKELRRITSAKYEELEAVTLHELYDAYQDAIEGISEEKIRKIVHPLETVLKEIPGVMIRDNTFESIKNGVILSVPGIIAYQNFEKDSNVKLLSVTGELIALGKTLLDSDSLTAMKNGNVIQPYKVLFT